MNDVKARDIMSEAVHQVSPRMNLIDLEHDLSAQRISGAPVVEQGKVVGIVSRSDIDRVLAQERARSAAAATFYGGGEGPGDAPDPTGAALEALRTLCVQDVMTKDVISVAPDDPVAAVARLMRDRRIHRVLVVDDGQLCGIVTALDIVGVVAERS